MQYAERLADDIDAASAIEEAERERLISGIRRAAQEPSLKPLGMCYYCGEEVPTPQIFCDHECADGYQHLLRARRLNVGF